MNPADPKHHPRGPRKRAAAALPVRQLAQLKRIAEATTVPYTSVRTCAQAGEFPVITIGRVQYVDVDVFNRWLDAKFSQAEREAEALRKQAAS